MRMIAVVSITLASLFLATSGTHAAPWCANYGFRTNCGFYSFAQCMAAVSGNAGFCSRNQFENPHWTGGDARRRYQRHN
jgi:hypothetical protein